MGFTVIGIACFLALVFAASGAPKVLGLAASRKTTAHVGLSEGIARVVGACEVAGAVGLIVGIWWLPAGLAAATGLFILMILGARAHLKVGDPVSKAVPAMVLGLLAAVVLVGNIWLITR